MSTKNKTITPAAPELPHGTQPLAESYQLGKASVCYHDAEGNAYNAQQRYVGKAKPAASAPAKVEDAKAPEAKAAK